MDAFYAVILIVAIVFGLINIIQLFAYRSGTAWLSLIGILGACVSGGMAVAYFAA